MGDKNSPKQTVKLGKKAKVRNITMKNSDIGDRLTFGSATKKSLSTTVGKVGAVVALIGGIAAVVFFLRGQLTEGTTGIVLGVLGLVLAVIPILQG